jgi:hypothetical protein
VREKILGVLEAPRFQLTRIEQMNNRLPHRGVIIKNADGFRLASIVAVTSSRTNEGLGLSSLDWSIDDLYFFVFCRLTWRTAFCIFRQTVLPLSIEHVIGKPSQLRWQSRLSRMSPRRNSGPVRRYRFAGLIYSRARSKPQR